MLLSGVSLEKEEKAYRAESRWERSARGLRERRSARHTLSDGRRDSCKTLLTELIKWVVESRYEHLVWRGLLGT